MRVTRFAWLGVCALAGAGLIFQACTGGSEDDPLSDAACGNGQIEGSEECDDANTENNDACRNDCITAFCGDGIPATVSGEECDDGNADDGDCCLSDCTVNDALPGCDALCGNGDIDGIEECDDGGDSATCDADCTSAVCGDGYVNSAAGETCEPSEVQNCENCGVPTTTGMGGDPCQGQSTYAGVVTDNMTPTNDPGGAGILSVWSYSGELGVLAGNRMCQQINADHVCSYKEIVEAEAKGELAGLPDGMTFWLHRVTETVPQVLDPNSMTPPGAGARCNDWTYPTNHISDGEYGIIGNYLDDNGTAGGRLIGNVSYYFDDNSNYTGNPGPQGSGPGAAGPCGANAQTPPRRALMCCFPICTSN